LASATTEGGGSGNHHEHHEQQWRPARLVNVKTGGVAQVRLRAEASSPVSGTIPYGAVDLAVGSCRAVTGYSQRWCFVKYQAVEGWISAYYLEKTAKPVS
jgi:hypothetical protein